MRFLGGESTESEEADPSQLLTAIKLARRSCSASPLVSSSFPLLPCTYFFPSRFVTSLFLLDSVFFFACFVLFLHGIRLRSASAIVRLHFVCF